LSSQANLGFQDKSSAANLGIQLPERKEEEEYKDQILTSKRSHDDDDSQLLDQNGNNIKLD